MQREIKFRGKRVDTGEWVVGMLPRHDSQSFITVYRKSVGGFNKWSDTYEVLPESVGQYTGLKDKNGTDIYEGDVCEFFNKYNETWYNRVVRYCPMFACFGLYPDMEEKWNYESDWLKITQIQIIGNTIDNPELIIP